MTAPKLKHMDTDLLIAGAGPAGMAAAVRATSLGLRVVVLDENLAAGGRIWQALERRGTTDADEAEGLALIHAFNICGATIHFNAGMWGIEADGTVYWTKDNVARSIRARRVLLATGTTERPMPIQGWTLPGVMTVGAAQIALKTAGLVPDANTWIAGQGPLIPLYVSQVLKAGGRIAGILDLSNPTARWRAIRHAPAALPEIIKGLSWLRAIRRAGIPHISASAIHAIGETSLRAISFRSLGREQTVPADLLLLHDGVIPSIQLTRALGCAHEWNREHDCWQPITNEWGETSHPLIAVAGDGAGVAGAAAAILSGEIAAIGAAKALGAIDTRTAAPLRARLARIHAARRFIDTLFAPLNIAPGDATLICRCEDVTAGEIRAAIKTGCLGLNQLKAFTRCGMGPCQGRMCGTSAHRIVANARGLDPSEIEPFRTRFPARPLTVGELAALDP